MAATATAAADESVSAEELRQFLSLQARADLRTMAMGYVLGLTASAEMEQFFLQHPDLIQLVIDIANDRRLEPVARKAVGALVNLSSSPALLPHLVDGKDLLGFLLCVVSDPTVSYPDEPCMLLSNLTRDEGVARRIVATELTEGDTKVSAVARLTDVFVKAELHNPRGSFDYLGTVLLNLTQTEEGRAMLLARGTLLKRLLPFTIHKTSITRRGGVIGVIRNCCFTTEHHEALLADDELLVSILLPLAGPEELDEDDMDGMPDDLQFLDDDKERDPDPELRKMLLESLFQLCATRLGRDKFKEKKVYPILREYHKWETDEQVQMACENVVHMLISDEDPGIDNFKALDIPDKVTASFERSTAAAAAAVETDKADALTADAAATGAQEKEAS